MVRRNNDGTALDILNTIELTDTKLLEIKEWLISTLTEQYESFMLSMKLEKIESNLDKINSSIVELCTTLKLMREDKI